MPLTVAPQRSIASRTTRTHIGPRAAQPNRVHRRERTMPAEGESLATYVDADGRTREVVQRRGASGSVLVIDRDATTFGERRLVAHIAADEPARNARIACEQYMSDPAGRWCRRVTPDDLRIFPATQDDPVACADPECGHEPRRGECLLDARGDSYRLEAVTGEMSIPELRWCRRRAGTSGGEPVSVRDAVGGIESYAPVRAMTAAAIATHRHDPDISVATLSVELERVSTSRIVLNRGLREATLAAVSAGMVTMSEIALRCGRVKRDRRGASSGETTWLARRLGLTGEGGGSEPTPWVHSEVLGLIARHGLGVAPREVELG